MAITDIVTVGGGSLLASGLLGRDCAMPITRLTKRMGTDEVLMNMPAFTGYWDDGTVLPVELTQSIDVDTTLVEDDCDVAVVDAALTEGELVAPNMKKIKLATKTLVVDQLIPAFCKQRNVARRDLGLILNPDGSIDTGNPYAADFARFALASVSKALATILAQRVLRGDESDDFGFDGLYTQLTSGWTQGSPVVPQYLNQAIQIDWQVLTGAAGATTPDDETEAGHTISLWGETVDVPVGLNLAELFEDFLIPAIETHWTDAEGGVDAWEMHVPAGQKRCIINTTACIRPCTGMVIEFDESLRELFRDLRARDVARFWPSEREVPIWESPLIEPDTMWFGPRSIGGSPTYGVVFQDMNELFASIGILGSTYGQGSGYFEADEPLLTDVRDTLEGPFESYAIHYDVEKISIDCVQASLMTKVGVLATARHLWIKVSNVTCASFITNVDSGVTIDGAAIEGTPAAPALTAPANGADTADLTPDIDWAAVTGATSYDYEVADDSLFITVTQSGNVADPTTVKTLDAMVAATTHYWRVRARNANGTGPWSVTRSFVVTAP